MLFTCQASSDVSPILFHTTQTGTASRISANCFTQVQPAFALTIRWSLLSASKRVSTCFYTVRSMRRHLQTSHCVCFDRRCHPLELARHHAKQLHSSRTRIYLATQFGGTSNARLPGCSNLVDSDGQNRCMRFVLSVIMT